MQSQFGHALFCPGIQKYCAIVLLSRKRGCALPVKNLLNEDDDEIFTKCLDEANGVWTQAAELLGCSESTVRRRAKKIGYQKKQVLIKRKLLFCDIETSPNMADVWGLWEQNVSLNQLRESSRMICFAAKYQGESKVEFCSEFHNSREEMIERAHALLSEADALVHYNGKKFDVPTLNREFLLAGLTPPAPTKQIDLYRVVKSKFHFPSYKLEYVAKALGLEGKVKHGGHELWVKCLAGDEESWGLMRKYNIRDTKLVDELYKKLLPWITDHPNMGLYDENALCPNCGSRNLKESGYAKTNVGAYPRYQCEDCGTWIRSNKRAFGVEVQSVK